jgi:hypothetical protein
LVSASLVAPAEVANEIDDFANAIGAFLTKTGVDARTDALSMDQFAQAMLGPAKAQLSLINAIRRSLARDQGALSTALGGALTDAGRRDDDGAAAGRG